MSADQGFYHQQLSNGIELAVEVLPGRKTVAYDIRFLTGMVDEPADRLGLAYLTEQTITKGTGLRTGQQLLDAFDLLGAQHGTWVGRQAMGCRCLCLPEFVEQTLDLHAEFLRSPTFPQEACEIAVELAKQELTALDDDSDEVARRIINRQVYGERLGRHALGRADTLDRITRRDIEEFWRTHFGAARMQVAVAGPVRPERIVRHLERAFEGFGRTPTDGRSPHPVEFVARTTHQHKQLEQQQIYIAFPGVPITHPDYPVERLALGVLSDGMSSRLFVEVREKLALVYWVGAWHEHPRGAGMIFVGASSTPARCDETRRVLLREIDRLAEDITEAELRRVKTGIIARSETHGEITRARASELSSDLFHFGRPVPIAEKNARIEAVTSDDIRRYLMEHPRDALSIVTLGPRALDDVPREPTEPAAEHGQALIQA